MPVEESKETVQEPTQDEDVPDFKNQQNSDDETEVGSKEKIIREKIQTI
jgi:hypothetical protein